MPNDGEALKPKSGTDTTKKSKFDYAKGQSRDLPTPKNGTEVIIGTPQTLEQGLQSVCKKAFELNKEADAEKLQQMADRSELSKANSEFRDTQAIVGDFKDVISQNINDSINKSLKIIKKKNDQKLPIDQKDIVEIHASIHSTILASGVYYLSIRNSLPLESQESREYVAREKLGKPMIEFKKTIGNFLKALDNACPQKYANSLGSAFELEQKALWPAGVSLDDQDLTTIRNIYDEVEEKQKALIKELDSTTKFSQCLKNDKEKLEKYIKTCIEQEKLRKEKRRSNSTRSRL